MNYRAIFVFLVFLAAAFAIGAGLRSLLASSADLKIDHAQVDEIPVSIFRPLNAPAGPAIVIAHGFAGSQALMQPAAVTLAHAGYTAVTFDFAGHGRNARPLAGGIKDHKESARVLEEEIGKMIRFALTLPGAGPKSDAKRVGLVGHSMASDLIVDSAMHNAAVAGVVAFSIFGGPETASEPKNLLVIDGAWEVAALKDDGLRIVAMASGAAQPQEGVTYGDMARGAARRLVFARGAEHIGVIYSRDGLTEMRDWMNGVFDRTETGPIDVRGKALGLLFLGLVALALPLSHVLPTLSPAPLGAGLGWKRQWPIAIAPALLTPLLLWKAPTDFLPILLGDYLVVHFALYGALTFFGLWLSAKFGRRPAAPDPAAKSTAAASAVSWRNCILAAVPVIAYYGLGLGLPIDTFVTSIAPSSLRWLLIPAMLSSTVIYFLADEWLTRGPAAATGGYVFTKFCFVVSLAIAVALNPQKLFFLVIIVPVICIFFTVFGLVSRWTYARTRDPRVAALSNAFALAWSICATFPVVS